MSPRQIDTSESDRMGRAVMALIGVDPKTLKAGSVRCEFTGEDVRVEWDGIAVPDRDELLAVINGLKLRVR